MRHFILAHNVFLFFTSFILYFIYNVSFGVASSFISKCSLRFFELLSSVIAGLAWLDFRCSFSGRCDSRCMTTRRPASCVDDATVQLETAYTRSSGEPCNQRIPRSPSSLLCECRIPTGGDTPRCRLRRRTFDNVVLSNSILRLKLLQQQVLPGQQRKTVGHFAPNSASPTDRVRRRGDAATPKGGPVSRPRLSFSVCLIAVDRWT